MALRAALCRRVAISRGCRWACPLIDQLSEYGSISDSLPYPTQIRLAHDLGVTERTVRRWMVALVAVGVLVVIPSPPLRDPETGRWYRRRSHRYVLADRLARRAGPASPLRRRRLKPLDSPTGHNCPVTTYGKVTNQNGGRSEAADPPSTVVTKVADLRSAPPTHHPIEFAEHHTPNQDERERIAQLLAGLKAGLPRTRRRL